MRCRACTRAATVHYTQVDKGAKSEIHLCESCAWKNESISAVSWRSRELFERLALMLADRVDESPPSTLDYERRPSDGPPDWFARGNSALRCIACGGELRSTNQCFDLTLKHCPRCNVEHLLIDWGDEVIQIVPERTPAAFQEFLASFRSLPWPDAAQVFTYLQELLSQLPPPD